MGHSDEHESEARTIRSVRETLDLKCAALAELDPQADTLHAALPSFFVPWTYHSLRLQGGASVTVDDVRQTFDRFSKGERSPDVFEERLRAVLNHFRALEHLVAAWRQGRELDAALTREWHRLLGGSGEFRTGSTRRTGRTRLPNDELRPRDVPTPDAVHGLMAQYSEAEHYLNAPERYEGKHPVKQSIKDHYQFMRVCPFDDDNGLVARLILGYQLLRRRYPPAIIRIESRDVYAAHLNEPHQGAEGFWRIVTDDVTRRVDRLLSLARKDSHADSRIEAA